MTTRFLLIALCISLLACKQTSSTTQESAYPLLKYGPAQVTPEGDSLPYQVPVFGFVDQDSNMITHELVQGKVYVTDFFFTTCPSICPKMSQQMLRLHDEFAEEERLILLSHTIDPVHDTVATLKAYAEALGVNSHRWHMVTGEKDSLYNMARHYMVSALEDENAPGGYIHSGAFVLLDGQRHIRGYYDGTLAEEVDELMQDIRWLMEEGETTP